ILLFDIQRVGPQGVLHTALGVVHPLLNLGRREVVGSTGLGNCRLALNDVNDQGAFALGRPAFDVFVHLQTHGDFLDYHLSRFSLGHYSILFDNAYYLRTNPDVAANVEAGHIDAWSHFQNFGRYEGRSPSPLFDTQYYLEQNPDVGLAVGAGATTAYDHFLSHGVNEGRDFVPFFDTQFYLEQNPDVARAVEQGSTSAAMHFLGHGQNEPRPVSPFLDLGAYLEANADVGAAVNNGDIGAFTHLISHGIAEGRPLGNGVTLEQFANDPTFQAAVAQGNPLEALARVAEVTPFLPTFEPPANWEAPA